MPECQCHGLNPDCYQCNGKGWVSGDVVIMKGHDKSIPEGPFYLPVSSSKKRKSKAKQKGEVKIGTNCPHCGKYKIGLADHIRAKHPEESQIQHDEVLITAQILAQERPNSKEEVAYRAHPRKTNSRQVEGSRRMQKSSRRYLQRLGTGRSTDLDSDWDHAEQFLICPICKVWLKPRVFKKHIRDRHPEAQKNDWFINLNRK